jgi:hypothetical protein
LFSLLLHFQTADSEKPARRRPTSLLWLLFESPRYLPSSRSDQLCLGLTSPFLCVNMYFLFLPYAVCPSILHASL